MTKFSILNGTTLMERLPNINAADGTAYTEYALSPTMSANFVLSGCLGANGSTVLVDINPNPVAAGR